jgi:dTDP-4-dehydrorhamnose 3,5-epimerase
VRSDRLSLPDVILFTPTAYRDERGVFIELHRTSEIFGDSDTNFVQSNMSTSIAWTLRGLHYQVKDPQGKLVRCLSGAIYDVAVDMRADSPTLGQWCGARLTSEECAGLWVPPGFAHGFLALAMPVLVHYECSSYYVESYNRTVRWDDPDLGIRWPLGADRTPVLSGKDRNALSFAEAERIIL